MEEIPVLIRQIYDIVNKLESKFPGRRFTPDGHMVGSIGEVLVAHYYNLELLSNSTAIHDARSKDNRLVQIKITQGNSVALRSQPDYLIVMKLNKDGSVTEVYNGTGAEPWGRAGKMQSNGQRPISLTKLLELSSQVDIRDRIMKMY